MARYNALQSAATQALRLRVPEADMGEHVVSKEDVRALRRNRQDERPKTQEDRCG